MGLRKVCISFFVGEYYTVSLLFLMIIYYLSVFKPNSVSVDIELTGDSYSVTTFS